MCASVKNNYAFMDFVPLDWEKPVVCVSVRIP